MSADGWIVTFALAPFGLLMLYVLIGLPIRMWYGKRHPPPPIVFPPPRHRLADNVGVPIEDVIRQAEKDAVNRDDGHEMQMTWVWM